MSLCRWLFASFTILLPGITLGAEYERPESMWCLNCSDDTRSNEKMNVNVCHIQYKTRSTTQLKISQISNVTPWTFSIDTPLAQVITSKDAQGFAALDTATFDFGDGKLVILKTLNRDTHDTEVSINFPIFTYVAVPGPRKCSLSTPRPIFTGGN